MVRECVHSIRLQRPQTVQHCRSRLHSHCGIVRLEFARTICLFSNPALASRIQSDRCWRFHLRDWWRWLARRFTSRYTRPVRGNKITIHIIYVLKALRSCRFIWFADFARKAGTRVTFGKHANRRLFRYSALSQPNWMAESTLLAETMAMDNIQINSFATTPKQTHGPRRLASNCRLQMLFYSR